MSKWMLAAVAAVALSVASLVIAQPPVFHPKPGPIFNNTNTTQKCGDCMSTRVQMCAWLSHGCQPAGLCFTYMQQCIDDALCDCLGVNCDFTCDPYFCAFE
jgi:hypothetical protein